MAEDELNARACEPTAHRGTPPDVPEVTRDARAGAVVHAAIAASVRTLILQEPNLRDAIDDEAVHKARVSTRRLRSDLRTFETLLDPDWTLWAGEELRWLGGRLGAARDADVLRGRVRMSLDRLPAGDVEGTELLLAPLVARRQRARRELRETIRTRRYDQLLDALIDAALRPPLRGAAKARAAKALPPLVEDRWRSLHRAVRRAGNTPDAQHLHRIRIRAKRVRYAAEAVRPAVGKPAHRLAARMEAVQELLGRHHDAIVAGSWLREVARDADAEVAFPAGEVAALQLVELAEIEAAWPGSWRSASRKRYREWL